MNRKSTLLLICIFISPTIIKSQTAFTGDHFGGRLWYQPTNFSVGSYSGHTVCGDSNQLYSWGTNVHGELGFSNWRSQDLPVMVEGMSQVYYYSAGYVAGAIKRDMSGWVWGKSIGKPTHVIDDVVYLDAGERAVTFIKKDGTVWSVGENFRGTFGHGEMSGKFTTPVKMAIITDAVRVANGYLTTTILRRNGTVWVCGSNQNQGLGATKPLQALKPIVIPELQNIVAIASNRHTNLALNRIGEVFIWGYGNGNQNRTIRKVEGLSNIVAISARNDGGHFMALDSSGNCYSWGDSYYWQVGNGTDNRVKTPVLVATEVIDILAGESFSYIVKKDMSLWACGTSRGGSIWLGASNNTRSTFTLLSVDWDKLGICMPRYADFSNYSENSTTLCEGDPLIVGDVKHYLAGSYADTLTNHFGFDSLVVSSLKIIPWQRDSISLTICTGDSVYFHNKAYWQSGVYIDTVKHSNPCKTITSVEVKLLPRSFLKQEIHLCPEKFVQVANHQYSSSGVYRDTLTNSIGCDSIITTKIISEDRYFETERYQFCPGDTVFTRNLVISSPTEARVTFQTAWGCDSIIFVMVDTFKDIRCYDGTIFIPTAFTPNNDGRNDEFGFVEEHITWAHLRIFNRWGQNVFESEASHPLWDGNFLNKPCQTGIYHYILDAVTIKGVAKHYTGTVNLIR